MFGFGRLRWRAKLKQTTEAGERDPKPQDALPRGNLGLELFGWPVTAHRRDVEVRHQHSAAERRGTTVETEKVEDREPSCQGLAAGRR